MDDDGLSREQIEDCRPDHAYGVGAMDSWIVTPERLNALCDLALAALESRSEAGQRAMDEGRAQSMIQATISHVDGRDLLEELKPNHWHYCDIHVRINGAWKVFQGDWLKRLYKARGSIDWRTIPENSPSLRAEPGAPELAQVAMARAAGIEVVRAKPEPDHAAEQVSSRMPNQAQRPASVAPEVAAPVTRKEPEPLVANRDGTAAAYDIKRIILDAVLAAENEGRARGREEGLEEAAKVVENCPASLGALERKYRELAAAIRTKIKPTRGQ